ncbi:MAG: hypothetical protein ACJAUP_001420 [Cellvibrionaceae bacterium]
MIVGVDRCSSNNINDFDVISPEASRDQLARFIEAGILSNTGEISAISIITVNYTDNTCSMVDKILIINSAITI